MDAFEIQERLKAVEREKVKTGRIDWYDRNVPNWWSSLKDMFDDPVWDGELDDYCARWFGHSEAEMREVFWGKAREEAVRELNEPDSIDRNIGVSRITEQIIDKKKEAAKRYREKNRERLAAEEKARRSK